MIIIFTLLCNGVLYIEVTIFTMFRLGCYILLWSRPGSLCKYQEVLLFHIFKAPLNTMLHSSLTRDLELHAEAELLVGVDLAGVAARVLGPHPRHLQLVHAAAARGAGDGDPGVGGEDEAAHGEDRHVAGPQPGHQVAGPQAAAGVTVAPLYLDNITCSLGCVSNKEVFGAAVTKSCFYQFSVRAVRAVFLPHMHN